MPVRSLLKPHLYMDSVALMRVAELLSGTPGIRAASLMMGTPANKEILAAAGRLAEAVRSAAPDDLMIVLEANTPEALEAGLAEAERLLVGRGEQAGAGVRPDQPPRSLAAALARLQGASLVQISTPGAYAGAEALKALRRGLHVFLFSDNVPLDQEVHCKQVAQRKGLLVMGPDCGTAIIGGVALGFANVVRRGGIGIVGASGTGLQQVTSLVHRLGEGVSHAIGTGSRDLTEAVGGVTTRQAFALLRADAATRVVVLLSKPPSPGVAARLLEQAEGFGKPLVVLFLGADPARVRAAGAVPATTLDEAARAAVALARGAPVAAPQEAPDAGEAGRAALRQLAPSQCYLRGLFSGGTFCAEAQVVWRQAGLASFSNAPLDPASRLADARLSREHTAVDLGSDEFTVGRPHPMIDFRTRAERLVREAQDPTAAVILLDVVLGFGAHADPAAALLPAIAEARAVAGRDGRHLALVASVCGTEEDPQQLSAQEARLREAGVLLADSNAAASRLAAWIATRGSGQREGSA